MDEIENLSEIGLTPERLTEAVYANRNPTIGFDGIASITEWSGGNSALNVWVAESGLTEAYGQSYNATVAANFFSSGLPGVVPLTDWTFGTNNQTPGIDELREMFFSAVAVAGDDSLNLVTGVLQTRYVETANIGIEVVAERYPNWSQAEVYAYVRNVFISELVNHPAGGGAEEVLAIRVNFGRSISENFE